MWNSKKYPTLKTPPFLKCVHPSLTIWWETNLMEAIQGPTDYGTCGEKEKDILDGPIYQVWNQSHASNPSVVAHKFNDFILKPLI